MVHWCFADWNVSEKNWPPWSNDPSDPIMYGESTWPWSFDPSDPSAPKVKRCQWSTDVSLIEISPRKIGPPDPTIHAILSCTVNQHGHDPSIQAIHQILRVKRCQWSTDVSLIEKSPRKIGPPDPTIQAILSCMVNQHGHDPSIQAIHQILRVGCQRCYLTSNVLLQ